MSQVQPQVNFIPLRSVVCQDSTTTLDIIVRISVPALPITGDRSPLNLGLVIDRSGSMTGAKIDYARQAACYLIEQLLPTDRVSVTIYDQVVDVIVPSTLATNKAHLLSKIKQVFPRGSTALHDGWLEGSTQVSQYLQPHQLNRVILLSDGLANVGETNPDVIGNNVHGLSRHGVSTTTMGVGNDFNEDLMQAIALSGDGHYYYIEHPQQLPDIFASELRGILATVGQQVSVAIETYSNVQVLDVLNDLAKNESGEYKLPNLIAGNQFDLVLRVKIPPQPASIPLLGVRLGYDDPKTGSRTRSHYQLQLPVVSAGELDNYPFQEEVKAKVAQLMISRAKDEAIRRIDSGDIAGTISWLENSRQQLQEYNIDPDTLASELAEINQLLANVRDQKLHLARKQAHFQSYSKRFHQK